MRTSMSHWGAFTAEVAADDTMRISSYGGDRLPSPMLGAIASANDHKSRIDRPAVRKGFLEKRQASDRAGRGSESFVEVSWATALDLAASELARCKAEAGNESIYAGSGWGSPGQFYSVRPLQARFLNAMGGYVEPVTNYSFGAASVIVPHVVGSMGSILGSHTSWPVVAQHTRLFVAFGGLPLKNAQVNYGGLSDHDVQDSYAAMAAAGIEFVSIGPLKDDAPAVLRPQHIPIRPGTDTAVMLGLAHTLLVEHLLDEVFLARYCVGFERFRPYLSGATDGQPKDAMWAAAISGMAPDVIRGLARKMASRRTMMSASWSIQRADHGEQPYWMLITLAAMLGQIGLPGGGFGFGYGAVNNIGKAVRPMPMPSLPSGRNPTGRVVPVARITDMLLSPGEPFDFNGQKLTYPDIKLIHWCGGNAFHQQQDLNRLLASWRKPETIIVQESWWTPTARRADIVLPAATTIERNDIAATPNERMWFAMQQVRAPRGLARNDYEIYAELAERLGTGAAFTEGRSERAWLVHMYDSARQAVSRLGVELPDFDAFWQNGHVVLPEAERPSILLEGYRRDPEKEALKTPSGRIEIFSERIASFGYDDCPGHPVWLEPGEWLGAPLARRFPLHLISNQPRHRLHSQLDPGAVSQAAKIAGREPVRLNPLDAAARGIQAGDVVRLFNDRGACLAGAILTDDVSPGVVELSTGAWFDPEDPASVGSLDKHGNPNVLTRDKGTSRLAQCSTAQTALVQVELCRNPPAVTAFEPPRLIVEN